MRNVNSHGDGQQTGGSGTSGSQAGGSQTVRDRYITVRLSEREMARLESAREGLRMSRSGFAGLVLVRGLDAIEAASEALDQIRS